MTTDELAKIARAVDAARAIPSFVFIPADAPPHIADGLRDYAAAAGKQAMEMPATGHARAAAIAAEHEARALRVVNLGDSEAFLENLDAIARGEARAR